MIENAPRSGGNIAYRGASGAIYLNITNRCSSDCVFCMRTWTDSIYGTDLRLANEPATEDILAAIEYAYMEGPAPEVVFCGLGEPTMRLDVVLAVTEWLRLRRIRTRLNTNGHAALLNPSVEVAAALAEAGLCAVAVSLNAADPLAYNAICRPTFAKAYRAVLEFAGDCVANSIETTLTAVDLPEADIPGCEVLAQRLGAAFRARRLVTSAQQREEEP